MKPKISMLLRAPSLPQLYVSLALLLFLIWSFIAVDLHHLHEEITAASRTRTQNLARIYAEEISDSISSIDYVLMDLRAQWKDDPIEFAAQVQLRQVYLDPSIGFEISVIGAQGELVFSSLDGNAAPIDLSDREYFSMQRQNPVDALFISHPLLGSVSHRWAIQFTRPLHKPQGAFEGLIVLSVSPEYFSRLHQIVDLGPASALALIRLNGEVLARSPEPELALGRSIMQAPFLNQSAVKTGYFQKHSEIDGTERLYSWQILPDTDLAVLVGQSTPALFHQYYHQRQTYFLGGTVGSVLLLVAGCFMFAYLRRRAFHAEEIEEMRTALQHSQKLEAIGRLTGGVAHDFNNILQIISGNIQMLQLTHHGSEQTERRLVSALEAVNRGAKLSSQLLTFARRQPLKPCVINIGKRIESIDELLKGIVGESVQIRLNITGELWNTLVDPDLLENAILNLAANARDAMHGRGTLTITLTNAALDRPHRSAQAATATNATSDYVLLSMTDTGIGMSPEVKERVFEPFFTTKPEGVGTGLGLSMTYGFVKQSGGHIDIESKLGQGTTIRIFLPRTLEAETHPPAIFSHCLTGGTETILVAEDDAEVRSVVSATLMQLGYHVIKTSDAENALKILETNKSVALLFTDVVMPGAMDGMALAKRAKSIRPELAVLLTSGYLYDSVKNTGQLDKDMQLLKKPYRREQLDAAIRQLLASRDEERCG